MQFVPQSQNCRGLRFRCRDEEADEAITGPQIEISAAVAIRRSSPPQIRLAADKEEIAPLAISSDVFWEASMACFICSEWPEEHRDRERKTSRRHGVLEEWGMVEPVLAEAEQLYEQLKTRPV